MGTKEWRKEPKEGMRVETKKFLDWVSTLPNPLLGFIPLSPFLCQALSAIILPTIILPTFCVLRVPRAQERVSAVSEEAIIVRALPRRLRAWVRQGETRSAVAANPRPLSHLARRGHAQQTRVELAIPYYERFLGRFPSARACALRRWTTCSSSGRGWGITPARAASTPPRGGSWPTTAESSHGASTT